MKILSLFTVAAFCLSLACASFAEPPKMEKEKGNPREILKKELGLTDEQLKKIDAIKVETEKAVEKSRYEIKNEKLTMKEQSLKGTLTRATLKESLKKIDESMSKIHAAFFQAALSVTDVLTDDQIKKLGEKDLLQRFLMIGEHGGMGPGDHRENGPGKEGHWNKD